jgi:two-component system, cell cycle sensor histidine kinase and response regulator CckA
VILATVYGIAQQSGGYITVASTPEQGATFTVSLPAVADGVVVTTAGGEPEDDTVGWETILLAEDEPAVRALTRNALVRQGYRVIEAGSGTEACELVEKQNIPIDLILTDVVMPGILWRCRWKSDRLGDREKHGRCAGAGDCAGDCRTRERSRPRLDRLTMVSAA